MRCQRCLSHLVRMDIVQGVPRYVCLNCGAGK